MRTQFYADKIKRGFTQIAILIILSSLLVTLCGCEAFVRKFTRKSKKARVEEEPVLVPEEYSLADIPVEERYRQSFLFWKSWQDELITALGSPASHKKRKDCLKEAIKNLQDIRPLLFQEKQKELDVYLEKLRRLEREISKDIYGTKLTTHRARAESLKRNISRDFSYTKIKSHLR